MKKITPMIVTAILMLAFTIDAAAQPPVHAKAYGRHKFYYYPATNVYYDPSPNLYYYNNGTIWSGVTVLPSGMVVNSGSPRVIVYHDGPEVWYDNKVHVVKYKDYKYKPVKYKKQKNKKHGRDD